MGQMIIMDRVETITAVLAALGNIVRRTQAGSLDQDTFYQLAGEMRRDLKRLRVDLADEVEEVGQISLTDLGRSVAGLLESGAVRPAVELLDRLPDRCRTYGQFTVIDGDIPFEHQQGA